ncbi:hypothetical protein F4780DRAFT_632167 [Xylariomycetidae sp. FL0641]|nr:hypothetical protein F4780DRAFT_632167 [Xylariomycetidae sp. FL0641]
MQQAPAQPNGTPNRRRPGGRSRNSPNKVYASENDLPSRKLDYASPSTPQKSGSNGGAPTSARATTSQKQRSKSNRNRNKNGSHSPANAYQDSPSSLPQDVSNIFAGSTFHASPAPSALPMPSFLGAPRGDSPGMKSPGMKPRISPAPEPSPPATDSDEASPEQKVPVKRNEESPLEFFFRADRAEKEQTRRVSSAHANDATPRRSSPPAASPREFNTMPKVANPHRRPNQAQRTISAGTATSDNRSSEHNIGPAFSTPYHERLRAARGSQVPLHEELGIKTTEDLRHYLKYGRVDPSLSTQSQHEPGPSPSTQSAPKPRVLFPYQQSQHSPQGSVQSPRNDKLPPGVFPASVLAAPATVTRSTSQPGPNEQVERMQALEGNLRRVLKLDT